MIMSRMHLSHRRWIIATAGGLLLLAILVIVLVQTGVIATGRVYTVDEAVAKRALLNGRTITLRGYSVFTPISSMQLCDPPRCDCNESLAYGFWLISEDTLAAGLERKDFFDHTIAVEGMDCRGDECSITCTPINPRTENELEVTGRFINDPKNATYPMLEVGSWEQAREKIGGEWAAVETGSFTLQLREP
jgi:hypothetical protein